MLEPRVRSSGRTTSTQPKTNMKTKTEKRGGGKGRHSKRPRWWRRLVHRLNMKFPEYLGSLKD